GVQDIFVARLAAGPNWLVTGGVSQVRGFDALGQATALAPAVADLGSTRVTLGDVNGDGAPDLIVGAGVDSTVGSPGRLFPGSAGATPLADFDANGGGGPPGDRAAPRC